MGKRSAPILSVMLDEIESIDQALKSVTFDEFCNQWQLRRAVQRGIEIISEASRRLNDDVKAERPDINWRQVGAIGNILRHEYHKISDKVIWDVVRHDFPPLKAALSDLREKYSE